MDQLSSTTERFQAEKASHLSSLVQTIKHGSVLQDSKSEKHSYISHTFSEPDILTDYK